LGGRLTVRLRTLDPPIGVRIPASQLNPSNKLRAADQPPFIILYHYCITALLNGVRSDFIVAAGFPKMMLEQVRPASGRAHPVVERDSATQRMMIAFPLIAVPVRS
jgi:hypothetical protein